MYNSMINACQQGGSFMFFFGILLLTLIALSIAALLKYLFRSEARPDPYPRRWTSSLPDNDGRRR